MAGREIVKQTVPSDSDSDSDSYSHLPADLLGTNEVFLNFRGSDTRHGFTDHLYHALVDATVDTFRDNERLHIGEDIGPELLKAIKDSKISIPIFSKNYANSKWCLREFARMVKCWRKGEQKIYPIFYNVKPSEVQHVGRKSSSYNKAFVKYKNDKKLDKKTVKKWKAALRKVGELKGWELKTETEGYEGALVKIIVEKVLSKLKKHNMHLPKDLVGMHTHKKKLKELLNNDSNGVQVIAIVGMSGLGKSTMAKAMYNEVNKFFEFHCFLEYVGGKSQNQDDLIIKMQKQLISNFLNRESPEILNVDGGTKNIEEAIRGRKVFIVIDNVDEKDQIEKFAVKQSNWDLYGAGSIVVITTTNTAVLLESEVIRHYKPKLMKDKYALTLFSRHAFGMDSPPQGFHGLANDVVLNAGGLPLVLVTLGSLLSIEKDDVSWKIKLDKLKAMPPCEVRGRLRISYDALDEMQKEIFLDIACLFSGVDKTNPCYMWDDCEYYSSEALTALVRRSLITVGDDNKLWMHDGLRELGKHIIRQGNWDQQGEWSRLWLFKDARKIIKPYPPGTKNVKVLRLNSEDFEKIADFDELPPRLEGQDFGNLPNLRYLTMRFIDLDGNFDNCFPNLRWLQWQWCSGKCAPNNFNLQNLVILDLTQSKITDVWGLWSQIKMAKKLKVLILSYCSELRTVPHLSMLSTLERLELRACQYLERLDGLEELESLKFLKASYCSALKILPDLSKLTNLQTLDVESCFELIEVQGLDELKSLELLNMNYCSKLDGLPNLSNLQKLTRFEACHCSELVEIQGLDKLASLEYLDISHCLSLQRLPDLSNFKKLRELNSQGLKLEVQGLSSLLSLEQLDMSGQECIKQLSDLSKLTRLRDLSISSCHNLIMIQDLGGLQSLEYLDMHKCKALRSLPTLSKLKRLNELIISCCDELIEIRDLDGLESLEILDVSKCRSLKGLQDLSNLRKLKYLNIEGCCMLVKIQGLGGLESLESLDLSSCKALEDMPDLTICKKLKTLRLCFLEQLSEIQGLEELKSLELLDVSGCKSIKNLPEFSNLTNLKKLFVSFCKKLTKIRGLEELKFLEELHVHGCKSLKNLPDLPNTTVYCIYGNYGWYTAELNRRSFLRSRMMVHRNYGWYHGSMDGIVDRSFGPGSFLRFRMRKDQERSRIVPSVPDA